MDNVLLRKKTLKAQLGVGKYTADTVEYVLNNEPSYLEWVYYSVRDVTFTDDILDALGITKEFRFEKPGNNQEMLNKFRQYRRQQWVDEAETEEEKKLRRYKIHAKIKKQYRIKHRRLLREGIERDRLQNSKGRLAWKNQGH